MNKSERQNRIVKIKRLIGLGMLGLLTGAGIAGLLRIMGTRDFLLYEVCGGGAVMAYVIVAVGLITSERRVDE